MTQITQELKRIKTYIEEYNDILIFYSLKNNPFSSFLALALLFSLKNLNKNASILNVSFEKDCFPLKTSSFVESAKKQSPSGFIISIKEQSGINISSLSYEKTDNVLNIFLSGAGNLNVKNISFKPAKRETLLIGLGAKNLNEAPTLPEKTFLVLNIDNSKENEGFGQVNLVDSRFSLSDIIFRIIEMLEPSSLPKKAVLPLFFSFLKEVFLDKNKFYQESALKTILFLKEKLSLEERKILEKWLFNLENKEEKLFYFSLLKSSFTDQNVLSISFSQNEFEKTKTDYNQIPFILQRFSPVLEEKRNFLLLWEQNSSPIAVRGIFYSKNSQKEKRALLTNFQGQEKNNWLLFRTNFKSVEQAKTEINKIIC